MVTSGRAAGVVDFALPFTAEGFDPQTALAAGRCGGKLIIVNSEAEDPTGLLGLNEDAAAMRTRAALCPPLTFTETYRDYYEAFIAIVPCGG